MDAEGWAAYREYNEEAAAEQQRGLTIQLLVVGYCSIPLWVIGYVHHIEPHVKQILGYFQ